MSSYFNQLSLREKIKQLSFCKLFSSQDFKNKAQALENKKIVILGCGAQGFHQGLNLRDNNLDVSFALKQSSIDNNKESFQKAKNANFKVGSIEELVPQADLLMNLTPDKQHQAVIEQVMPLMKQNSILGYSHGFHIIEQNPQIRDDITVIMIAPKGPGTEVRTEFCNNFGVPTLIAVHDKYNPHNIGLEYAKAYAYATGGSRAGVLQASFAGEVKTDLMGEQVILCGLLETATITLFDKMCSSGYKPEYAEKILQEGWSVITDTLKVGGIHLMMNQLPAFTKSQVNDIANKIKVILRPICYKHWEDILSGNFSSNLIKDWHNNDKDLLKWREDIASSNFEKTKSTSEEISTSEYFKHNLPLIAYIKAGVELCFETMIETGINPAMAYYESLHELPLIAYLVSRKKLYEVNCVISDTAEYGAYLFINNSLNLVKEINDTEMNKLFELIKSNKYSNTIDDFKLKQLESDLLNHPIEKIGSKLRSLVNLRKLNRS